jgi:hypothetical protein
VALSQDGGVNLFGLGENLEQMEQKVREQLEGRDTRRFDAQGHLRPPRPGYDHPDPWYDGRGHAYTIIDAPHAGTSLTADQIESLLLDYGHADERHFRRLA